jgi:hypothetical protein
MAERDEEFTDGLIHALAHPKVRKALKEVIAEVMLSPEMMRALILAATTTVVPENGDVAIMELDLDARSRNCLVHYCRQDGSLCPEDSCSRILEVDAPHRILNFGKHCFCVTVRALLQAGTPKAEILASRFWTTAPARFQKAGIAALEDQQETEDQPK